VNQHSGDRGCGNDGRLRRPSSLLQEERNRWSPSRRRQRREVLRPRAGPYV